MQGIVVCTARLLRDLAGAGHIYAMMLGVLDGLSLGLSGVVDRNSTGRCAVYVVRFVGWLES